MHGGALCTVRCSILPTTDRIISLNSIKWLSLVMKMQSVYWEVDIAFCILRNWICFPIDRDLCLISGREPQAGLGQDRRIVVVMLHRVNNRLTWQQLRLHQTDRTGYHPTHCHCTNVIELCGCWHVTCYKYLSPCNRHSWAADSCLVCTKFVAFCETCHDSCRMMHWQSCARREGAGQELFLVF